MPSVRVRLLSAVAYAGMFVFGIVMALLGAVMPSVSERLAFSLSEAGTLFLVMNFAMLVTSLLIGVAMDRFGMKAPLAVGPWLVAAALIVIANATRFANLLPGVIALGIGGGALNAATNTLVADLHEDEQKKASALNVLGVFFGFGALFLPFTIGALLSTFGISKLLMFAAVLCAIAGWFAVVLHFPAPKQAHRLPVADMPRFIAMPVVLATAFLLFFESGNEFILAGYFASFLVREMGTGVSEAAYLLAGYWAALIAARIVLSRVLLRYDGHAVVLASALLAAVGCIVVGVAPGTAAAAGGIVITGAALAGIYPTVLGIAGSRFREHSGTVFGILFTVALAGGMTMPWLSGRLADAQGLRWVFALAAANFLAVAILNQVAKRAGSAA